MTTNNSYQYSTIGHDNDEENTALSRYAFSKERSENNNNKKYSAYFFILTGVVMMGALFLATFMHTSSRSSAPAALEHGNAVALLGMAKTRSCTFKECFGNSCNQESAPFICLRHNGGPHMGW
jgi:hypothetical protein